MDSDESVLNETLSPDEQDAILHGAILGHHQSVMAELYALLAELKEHPEQVTKEHVVLVKDVVAVQAGWLRAHGVDAWVDVKEATGIDGVQAGDKL